MRANTSLQSGINWRKRSKLTAHLLARQLFETQRLIGHLESAKVAMERTTHPKIIFLLDHIKSELYNCKEQLQSCLGSPSDDQVLPADESEPNPLRRLYATHLEVLNEECGQYLRSTRIIIDKLKILGREEQLKIVEKMSSIAELGMSLTDVYANGLAIRMDPGHLPDWPEESREASAWHR